MKIRFLNWLFLISILLVLADDISSQSIDPSVDKNSKLKITVQKIDSIGVAWRSYSFENSKIRIYEKPFTNSIFHEHLHTINKFNSREFLKKVNEVRLDTLNENNYNNCLDKLKGKRLVLEFEANGIKRSLMVHEYYLTSIDELIKMINNQIPSSFAITYFSPATKQDCP